MGKSAAAVVMLLVFVGVCSADVYRYTDSQGNINFVDDLGNVPKKYRKQAESAGSQWGVSVEDATPSPPVPGDRATPKTQKQVKIERQVSRTSDRPQVVLYKTSWCGYCKKMAQFLNKMGIPYTAYDIEKDSAAARTFSKLGGRGVPVVQVGSHTVRGYNPDAVMAYYNGGK